MWNAYRAYRSRYRSTNRRNASTSPRNTRETIRASELATSTKHRPGLSALGHTTKRHRSLSLPCQRSTVPRSIKRPSTPCCLDQDVRRRKSWRETGVQMLHLLYDRFGANAVNVSKGTAAEGREPD